MKLKKIRVFYIALLEGEKKKREKEKSIARNSVGKSGISNGGPRQNCREKTEVFYTCVSSRNRRIFGTTLIKNLKQMNRH